MASSFHFLERVIVKAPLGLRFVDLTQNKVVTDGMMVAARAIGADTPWLWAMRSPQSGIYGFRTLPGLSSYERGEQPATNWCPNDGSPTTPNFVITITDRERRFLSQTMQLCLPKTEIVEVPLYSSPSRIAPGSYAIIRGDLWNNDSDQPAGWAMISATPDGISTYATVADARGSFVLFVPVPPLESSPVFNTVPVPELHWPFTFEVFFEPAAQEQVTDNDNDPPDTTSIVEQSAAQIFNTVSTSAAALVRNLNFGTELILSTQGQSRLLIDPA